MFCKLKIIALTLASICLLQACSEEAPTPTSNPPIAPTASTQALSPGSIQGYNNQMSNYQEQKRKDTAKAQAIADSILAQKATAQAAQASKLNPTGASTTTPAPIPAYTQPRGE
jgi:PBP1b-binding outer membrane lipoprotein LpoB